MANGEDQYDVVRPIGSGSFGQVFLVVHRLEQRCYVMKEIAAWATMDDKQRESTQLEVQLLSALTHPNIVGFRDSLVNGQGHLAIFMEYCEQGDVDTYLQESKKVGNMPGEAKVLEWFAQMVLAIHALHVRKILHRDLKTQNIFLTGSRVNHAFALKLGDFGIAKVLNTTMDLAMTQIGTPFYMSPEMFNNKPYGYKSDVWGLGCVLYEVVNGQRPFDAQSINGLAMKVVQGRYTPITSSCTDDTKLLIKSLLSTNPAHRPTLQEILHSPSVHRGIKPALQTVIAAGSPEVSVQAEMTFAEQLTSLGLGGLVNCPGSATGPRRDRRQLLQRLERAERRRKREEETLRRLQETAALLAQCLTDTAPPSHALLLDYSGEIEEVPPSSSFYAHGAPQRSSAHPVHLPIPALQYTDLSMDGDPYPPAMSHRDRVLLRKERRREEEQQKFEEEARKIREENLAYQRAWVQDSQRSRPLTKEPSQIAIATTNVQQQQQPLQPPHMLPHLALGGNQLAPPLAPVLGPDHIKSGNHFHSGHTNVNHTPRRQRHASPKPPKPTFASHEPPPPNAAPHHSSSRWSHFGRSDTGHAFQTSRSVHSVCLDALSNDGNERIPEHSEDSGQESLMDGGEDGLSDGGGRGWTNDEQVRNHAVAVQQRMEACRAAIYRHQMTIATMQYTIAQEGQEFAEQHPVPLSSVPSYGPELGSQLHPGGNDLDLVGPPQDSRYHGGGGTPAVVLDRIARLKRRCLEGLGTELFQATRQCLQSLLDAGVVAEAVRGEMIDKLGLEKIGFYSLIDQIVYMECRWGHCDAAPQWAPQELA